MKRREAVQYISLLLGGTIIGSNYFLEGCKSKTGVSMAFTPEDVSYLDEIADTILPATKTPGAKAAKVGQFMTVMINDCYDADDQKLFPDDERAYFIGIFYFGNWLYTGKALYRNAR
jgi:hypothetical protein